MNKYLCNGAIIRRKADHLKTGTVFSLDFKNGIVIAQSGENSYWSDKIKNIEVISYKGFR